MGPFPNHLYLNLYLIDWKCYSAPCVMHYVYYVPWAIICQCWSALLRHLANAETLRVSASQPDHCWARYLAGNIRAGLEARPAVPGRLPWELVPHNIGQMHYFIGSTIPFIYIHFGYLSLSTLLPFHRQSAEGTIMEYFYISPAQDSLFYIIILMLLLPFHFFCVYI